MLLCMCWVTVRRKKNFPWFKGLGERLWQSGGGGECSVVATKEGFAEWLGPVSSPEKEEGRRVFVLGFRGSCF